MGTSSQKLYESCDLRAITEDALMEEITSQHGMYFSGEKKTIDSGPNIH